jgi:uncharacterized CHY-type Zn-finger protein
MGEPIAHRWSYCSHCRRDMVICGKCGNNCCNGGYGNDGKCDACPSAYEEQDRADAIICTV